MLKVHNFSAGPAILPQEVLLQSAEAIKNFNKLSLSILEISHRSKEFVEIMERARQLVKELLNLGNRFEVLFLQGGASLQFAMIPLNLLTEKSCAAYVNTGVWATKAIKEAQKIGNIDVIASSEDKNFSYIPKIKINNLEKNFEYLHITSNNTIYGTQFQDFPETDIPLVVDMSSDIFSRNLDYNKFALIYAGAQKNLGPAGTTMIAINKDILKNKTNLPSMLDYKVHISKGSIFNTPPVFAIYVATLVMEWIKNNGGVSEMEKRNRKKAELFYNELDRNSMFEGIAEINSRSIMNATFVLKDKKQTIVNEFDKLCKEAGIVGLKGHRTIGGYRASMYNAMDIESVEVLVNVMAEFEKRFG